MGFAAATPLAIGAGSAIAGKLFGGPSTKQVNPNTPEIQGLQADFAKFLSGLMQDPSSGAFTSDLQRGATNSLMQFLGQPAPETKTLEALSPGLMNIFGTDTAQGVGEAAFPLFQRGLQDALGQLSNSAAGRFSTTFDRQGIGLGQRALQDFNLLQQQAFQQNIQNQLGAATLLGQLSGQAGQNPFNRLLGAAQLGTQQTSSNPVLQLLLGGMGFARPAPMDTVVGSSPLDNALGGISAWSLLRGGGGFGAPKPPEGLSLPGISGDWQDVGVG